jgi:phage-related protein/predicted XRE-type DNA-binding protein
MNGSARPVIWVGSSRRDLRGFPREVRREIGQALYTAQQGETDPSAKPLRGFGGASVLEIVAAQVGSTWRAVYTVCYREAIYVLHAFQKKSKRASPPQRRTSTSSVTAWLTRNASTEKGRTNVATRTRKPIRAEKSSGNVFADIGLPHPEQELLKAELTLRIYHLIKSRGLKQAEAGKILGIKQPHVSALMRNRAGSFSVERLMDFLTALGQNVHITVKPARKKHGKVSLVA